MLRKQAVFFMAIVFSAFIAVSASMADTQNAQASDKASVKAQLEGINAQIKAVIEELAGLYAQKDSLRDQIASLHTQKHLDGLNKHSLDLNAKLAEAQKKNDSVKTAEVTAKISLITKEISIQQAILALYTQLLDARKNMQKDKVKDIEAQIKANRDDMKALYPPKPATVTPPNNTTAAGPIPTPKPEDPDIQALLDQVKTIDAQIAQDKQKLADLKKQKEALKLQLKNN